MLDEGFEYLLRVAAGYGDLDAGVVFEEAGDEAGQQILTDGLGGAEGEAAGGISRGRGDSFAGPFGERGDLGGEGKQCFSGGSEGDAASAAIEESDAELSFEGLDLLGDGGLGEEELFGGLAEVQVAGDGTEDAEAEVFHG